MSRLLRRLAALAPRSAPSRRQLGYQQKQSQQMDADRQDLLDFFPRVLEDVLDASRVVGIPSETEHLRRLLEYNLVGGKLLRSCATLNACRELVTHRSPRDFKVLAWTLELLQGAYCIVDDVCDAGVTRRGQPCWHTLPQVGRSAITDVFLMESSIFQLLRKYFRDEENFADLLYLFCDVTFRCMLGESYDTHASAHGTVQFQEFTYERYAAQASYKTSYYTFYAPTAAAMHLAGISDPGSHQMVWDITGEIGILYQAQDDFLDCFASTANTGKEPSDIRNGKCTWLVLEAMKCADAEQHKALRENYGVEDPERVRAVQDLYHRLGVREAFLEYNRRTIEDLEERIERQRAVRPSVLRYVLDSVRHTTLRADLAT